MNLQNLSTGKKPTRIQREKTGKILDAALDVFSRFGFRGATLDQIADQAGLSKPNLLYYYNSKEDLHNELLAQLMDKWLEPLEKIDPIGSPIDEICSYVCRKLELARDFPRESRLFANEIIQGAPRIADSLTGPLKTLVDEKAALISAWAKAGRIADVDPYHLIFSIWSTTQHYADFDTQIRSVMEDNYASRFEGAENYLSHMFRSTLAI
ncbi:MAG: TetR family transcriptional regulator C-terminal domain-containing protein [Rhodobacteraceae bacterium]|nr:TetR family transcriptional regulator C-terminal domain-containing protein [Paracoccaceae bacterium]